MLKEKLKDILSSNSFTIKDAKELNTLNWKEETYLLPEDVKNTIDVFYAFIDGLIEEVEEGYVDGDESDEFLFQKTEEIFEMLKYHSFHLSRGGMHR